MKTLLLYTILVAGQGADITSTCAGIRSGRYAEANPVLPHSCAGIAAVKSSLVITAGSLYPFLRKRHPKWAVGVMVVPGLTGFAAAGFNVVVMWK